MQRVYPVSKHFKFRWHTKQQCRVNSLLPSEDMFDEYKSAWITSISNSLWLDFSEHFVSFDYTIHSTCRCYTRKVNSWISRETKTQFFQLNFKPETCTAVHGGGVRMLFLYCASVLHPSRSVRACNLWNIAYYLVCIFLVSCFLLLPCLTSLSDVCVILFLFLISIFRRRVVISILPIFFRVVCGLLGLCGGLYSVHVSDTYARRPTLLMFFCLKRRCALVIVCTTLSL